jgi:hypothetical protein
MCGTFAEHCEKKPRNIWSGLRILRLPQDFHPEFALCCCWWSACLGPTTPSEYVERAFPLYLQPPTLTTTLSFSVTSCQVASEAGSELLIQYVAHFEAELRGHPLLCLVTSPLCWGDLAKRIGMTRRDRGQHDLGMHTIVRWAKELGHAVSALARLGVVSLRVGT